MTNDKGILIKNIYYMLTYAFQVLKQTNYEEIAAEEFSEVQDLFAAILAKGISQQLKQGLYKEYVTKEDTLPVVRGKIDLSATMRNKIQHRRVMTCEFDELSENNLLNQILKTTAVFLIQSQKVSSKYRQALKRTMLLFESVDEIDPRSISWKRLTIRRNNKSYEMLLNICWFVLDGMLQTTENGKYRMANFKDEHMARLFEKFGVNHFSYGI